MMVPALSLSSLNSDKLPPEDMFKYYTVYFSGSDDNDDPANYTKGVLCSTLSGFAAHIDADMGDAMCPSADAIAANMM